MQYAELNLEQKQFQVARAPRRSPAQKHVQITKVN